MTDEQKWRAWSEKDVNFDGVLFCAVKTTGIFCRPSCPARPHKENVIFFDTAKEAMDAGFRPCKRCRPDLLEYQPLKELANKAKLLIDRHFTDKTRLKEELKSLGLTQHRLIEIFKSEYGLTINEYLDSLRLTLAKEKLAQTQEPIVQIAFEVGFGSIAAFYRFFKKYTAIAPAEFRKSLQLD